MTGWRDRDDREVLITIGSFLAACVLFTVLLRPFDYFNLNIFLYTGSYWLIGLNPARVIAVAPPPNLGVLSAVAALTYSASGFTLYLAVVLYKAVNSLAIVGSAIVSGLIVRQLTGKKSAERAVFCATLLSVPLFFYSMIHLELDAFGIFFSLAGVYILLPWVRTGQGSTIALLSGSVLLSYSVYAYLFPAVLVPALILYSKGAAGKVAAFIAIVLGLAIFTIPYLLTGTFSLLGSNLSVFSSTPSAYSLVWSLNPSGAAEILPRIELESILVVVAIAIPLLLRRLKIGLMPALACAMLSVFFVVPIYNADNFAWTLPFPLIAIASLWPETVKAQDLILVQLVVLPEIVVFNFYDGLVGMGTGVFYLFYPQFGNPTVIWRLIPSHVLVSQLLMLTTFTGLFAIAALLCLKSRLLSGPSSEQASLPGMPTAWTTRFRASISVLGAVPTRLRRDVTRSPLSFVVAAIFVVAVLLVSAVPVTTASELSVKSPDFPIGIFLVHPPPAANLTYQISADGRTMMTPPTDFYRNNGSVAFIRNNSEQTLSFAAVISSVGPPTALYNTTFFSGPGITASFASTVNLGLSVASLPAASVYNTTPVNLSGSQWGDTSIPVYGLNGSSLVRYVVPDPNSSSKLYLFAHAATLNFAQNVVWVLAFDKTEIELVDIETDWGSLGLGLLVSHAAGVWNTTYFYPTNNTYWQLTEFSVAQGVLTVSVNDIPVFSGEAGNQTLYLSVGRYDASTPTANHNALAGTASALLASPDGISIERALEVDVGSVPQVVALTNSSLSATVEASPSGVSLHALGYSWITYSASPTIALGRLSPSSVALTFTLTSLTLTSHVARSVLPMFLALTVVSPCLFGALYLVDRREENRALGR